MSSTTAAGSGPGAERVPARMRYGYAIGDFGANLAFQVTGFYLLFFFTDVFAVAPALAGSIILYAKIWDAITDPVMGSIADRTKSRWGRFRPYLLFGALPLGLTVFLLFLSPGLGEAGRYFYGLVTFIAFATAITVVNVPFLAMTPSLTRDSHERSVITGYRVFFGILGSLAAAGATLPLVGAFGGTDKVAGFRAVGLVYGAVVALATLVTFFTVRERVADPPRAKVGVKEALGAVLGNGPFLILTAGTFLHMIAMNTMSVVVNYYFKYNLKMEGMIPVAFGSLFVAAGLSLPLFVLISKRTGKKIAYNIGMGIVAAMLVVIFLAGDRTLRIGGLSVPVIFPILVVTGIGLSTNWLSPWSMIPDTVEYAEWKTGVRREGVLYGLFYFVFKFGTALAGYLVGSVLSLYGYVANVEQTARALGGIRIVMTVVPFILLAAGILCISFFPISAERHRKMVSEIEARAR